MKTKTNKLISTLLAVAMVFSLLAAMPMTASAANASELAAQLNTIAGLNATASGYSVTVLGTAAGNTQLSLDIDAGVIVNWYAKYSGAIGVPLIRLSGGGRLDILGGSIVNTGTGSAISVSGANATVTVWGGAKVEAIGDAISVSGANANIVVHVDSIVSSTGTVGAGSAIYLSGTSASSRVTVEGGTVGAAGPDWNHAICSAEGTTPVIEIKSGVVKSVGEQGTVHLKGTGTITVSGGVVENTGEGSAIYVNNGNGAANVYVSGGTVKATERITIYIPDTMSTVNVSGGAVEASESTAILAGIVNVSGTGLVKSAGDVVTIYSIDTKVSGGAVKAEGSGDAIYADTGGSAMVSGGVVSATTGNAICSIGSLAVSGGFVFAYGTGITGMSDVIYKSAGTPTIGGSAVVCAFNPPALAPTYTEGSSTNLTVSPSGATATWGKVGAQTGINYKNGANTGFFPIDGNITVNAPTGPAPNLNSADEWAREAIQKAFELGLVPDSLQSNYTASITRAEYCAIAVRFYETYTLGPISVFSDFTDTNDINVRKLAGVGVVNGNGDGTFTPNGVFNREQMAAITVNLLEAITGLAIPASNPTFSDMNQAEGWARPYIGQVQSAGIMQGVGDNKFDPKRNLDRQSAIMLTLNVYNSLGSH